MYVYERMNENSASVDAEATVSKAFQLMKENNTSQIPVVDKDNKIIGILTEKNLAEVNPKSKTALSSYEINILLSNVKVHDIMSTRIFKINENRLIEEAALMIKENHVELLAVVDDSDVLKGVITNLDVFKAFIEIMGLKDVGVSVSIQTEHPQDDIPQLTKLLHENNIKIIHICSFSVKGKSELLLRTEKTNIDDLTCLLEENGYNINTISNKF